MRKVTMDDEEFIPMANVSILSDRKRNYFQFSNENLRIVFLFLIGFIGLISFTVALIIGSAYVQFQRKCFLYAKFRFMLINDQSKNLTIRLDLQTSEFSSASTCDFCTFFNVLTFIFCIITAFFFVLFNGNHRIIQNNDRGLIVPWFSISSFLTLLSLINASILTNGFVRFCSMLTKQHSAVRYCSQLNQMTFEQFPSVSQLFFYMFIGIIASWFELVFFIGIVGILVIRLG